MRKLFYLGVITTAIVFFSLSFNRSNDLFDKDHFMNNVEALAANEDLELMTCCVSLGDVCIYKDMVIINHILLEGESCN